MNMKYVVIMFLAVTMACGSANDVSAQKGVMANMALADTMSYHVLKVVRERSNKRIPIFYLGEKPYTGVVRQSWPDNKVEYFFNVKNGKAFLQNVYYENGQTERRLEMKDGLEHGTFRMYFPDGKPYVEQFYDEGKPVGTWHRWDADGKLVETIYQDKN